MAGANGLNFCLRLIWFTISLTFGPLGSARNDLLPSALGPNSARPFATPHIIFFSNSFMILSIGYSPSMLCPKNGCCQFKNCFSLAATQPILEPASPGFGIIHMLSNIPRPANLLFAAQFNATPPPNTRLRSANSKLFAGKYEAALLHRLANSSSVNACIEAAMSIGSASGIQLPMPLCKLCLNLNGILLFINSL